jgi:OOP family OmpA-OmpF porin
MSRIRLTLALSALALPAACQTMPPRAAALQALRPEQVAMLRDQGFVERADGWAFDISSRILFPTDGHQVNPDQGERIARIARALCSVEIRAARVEGHADNTGSAGHNRTLSRARAEAVAQALASGGMPSGLLRAIGFGDTRPVETNNTASGRAENRRVAIIVPASSAEQGPCAQH